MISGDHYQIICLYNVHVGFELNKLFLAVRQI